MNETQIVNILTIIVHVAYPIIQLVVSSVWALLQQSWALVVLLSKTIKT